MRSFAVITNIVALLVIFHLPAHAQPCQNYRCDSLDVRSILDSAGLISRQVDSVTVRDSSTGRIVELHFPEGGGVTSLSGDVGRLAALRQLWLNMNALSALPPEIGNLASLEGLYIDRNRLSYLPAEIGNLRSLKELFLSGNYLLTALPSSIGNLTALQTISLSSCALSQLPSTIGALSHLTLLAAGNCSLDSVPESMGSLTALRYLFLTRNDLTTLPGSFTHLVNLQVLDLSRNRLCDLPSALHTWADKYNPGWESTQDCQTDARTGRIMPVIRASGGPRMTYDLRGRPAPFGAKSNANAPAGVYLVKGPHHRDMVVGMVIGPVAWFERN